MVELKPCPFCGGDIRIAQEPHDNHPVNGLWHLFHNYGEIGSRARKCLIAVPKYFDTEAEAIAAWNTRTDTARIQVLEAENARLREVLDRAREAVWFYYGDDCSSDACRFSIGECIDEDFECENDPEGDHVLRISGARTVPVMWIALHYFTNEEKDERQDDEPYAYTVHATEEAARQALADIPDLTTDQLSAIKALAGGRNQMGDPA